MCGAALAVVLAGVPLAVLAWREVLRGPLLVVRNASDGPLVDVAFEDRRGSGAASSPARWARIERGEQRVHRIRGDDQVHLAYTLNGRSHVHSGYTPVGRIEAWIVTIGPDGVATTNFGLAGEVP